MIRNYSYPSVDTPINTKLHFPGNKFKEIEPLWVPSVELVSLIHFVLYRIYQAAKCFF